MQEKTQKKSFERSGSTRKQIRFEDDLFNEIEKSRLTTNESFSEWVKDACNKKLGK
ncbi:YlcI/YnfO family protein [Marisediminitalea sp.]|uniref:YlcI/YnfO family protein n=1 Tax=Marisediminitalea sp. TaxID=2662268 RepID=UPI003513E958